MKPIPCAALALSILLALPLTGHADPARDHCAQKWDTDFAMQKYCIDQMTEAQGQIDRLGKTVRDHPLYAHCLGKWPEGQPDMRMYCIKQQVEATDAVIAMIDATEDGGTRRTVIDNCISKWSVAQADMVEYCINQQFDAMKELGLE